MTKLSLEIDDGKTCEILCHSEHGLLELLSEYLHDERQSENVKDDFLRVLSNICAEENENLKEAVIRRGNILKYFQGEGSAIQISDRLIQTLPGLLYNLYCQSVSKLLESKEIFDQCLLILNRSLSQILPGICNNGD